jgi:RHS repeat-associated protein
MLMPGRNSQSNLQGGFSSGGTTTVNGNTYVSNLTVTTRIGNTPNTYKAANSIEFVGEYVDNGGEEYEAFIVNQTNPDPNPTIGTVSSSSVDGYRYGFGGQEKDNEIYGNGNAYAAAFWEYDPRLGRRWNIDPKASEYPMWSPYLAMGNDPINNIDPDGQEPLRIFNVKQSDGTTVQKEIKDGVNEIVNIDEFHFDWLNKTFNDDKTATKDSYNSYYNQLGLGTTGYNVSETARSQVGSTDYAFDKKKGDFPENTDKCNKFVYDCLRTNGAIDAYPKGSPPTAAKYANPKTVIKGGLTVVDLTKDKPKLGDVIAGAHNYAGSTASGHVEIITHILPSGKFWTTGATDKAVETRLKGYKMLNGEEFEDRNGKFKYTPVTIRRPTNNNP